MLTRTAETLLDCLWRWETTRPDSIYCSQPVAPGIAVDYRWSVVADQVRQMASHLASLALPPASRIAIFGGNSAHWIMADLAIWAAGHVSVPVHPLATPDTVRDVLATSEARVLFVGKLPVEWEPFAAAIPDRVLRIALPLASAIGAQTWDALVGSAASGREPLRRRPDELATISYPGATRGDLTGAPATFGEMFEQAGVLGGIVPMRGDDRMLSHLPFAHDAARIMVEAVSLRHAVHLFFASGRDTMEDDLRRARPTLAFSPARAFVQFHADVHARAVPRRLHAILLRLPFAARAVQRRILARLGLDQIRAAIAASAAMPAEVVAWYRRIGLEILHGVPLAERAHEAAAVAPEKHAPVAT